MATSFTGSCYCGAIGFVYETDIAPERWSIRACQCRFCRAHAALSTSDPDGALRFTADRPDMLQRYRFGLRTSDFLLCRECGVYVGALIDTPQGQFGIINTHALTIAPERLATTAPISYDAEATEERVARRQQRWTPARLRT